MTNSPKNRTNILAIILCSLTAAVAGVAAGAFVFSTEHTVEVVRTVEKQVEVPGKLTPDQQAQLQFAARFYDAKQIKPELSPFKLSNRVLIRNDISKDDFPPNVSRDLITAKVETAFRNQGFKVLNSYSDDQEPITFIVIKGLQKKIDGVGITFGSYGISVLQSVTYFSPQEASKPEALTIKQSLVTLMHDGGIYFRSQSGLDNMPDPWCQAAEVSANNLRKILDN